MPLFIENRQFHSFCPICGDKNLKFKYTINNFTLVQCRSCELIFVKEICSQAELDYYYLADKNRAADDTGVYSNQGNIENLNYYYKKLRSLILARISAGKILDIGCNAGQFLDEMEGFERYGVERSPNHGKIAKAKYGGNIFIGTFEDYQAPDFLFDCITLQDVLDHLVNPLEALKKCHRLLKPNGLLVVKVHDMSSWFAKISGRKFYALIPPMHLFYFNRTALALALKEALFDVVFSKHLGHQMFLSTVFFRLSQGNENSIFFRLFKLLDRSRLGRIKIYKNLHDIITVLAVKK